MSLFAPEDPSGFTAWDYGSTIIAHLREIHAAVSNPDEGPISIRRRHPFVITLDASGVGTTEVFLPAGVAWTLLSYAVQAPSAAGFIAFYQDVEEGTALLQSSDLTVNPKAVNFSPDGDQIPEQSKLLIVVRGALASAVVSGNVKCRGIMDSPPPMNPRGDSD